eukprot:g28129.t1
MRKGCYSLWESLGVQQDLDQTGKWAEEWQMEFNLDKCEGHLSKPYLKRPEKAKGRKKVVAARRKYQRRMAKQKWNTSSASDEDGDSLSFRHRRPNASKFSKIGPNSCVFLPVPEDIFIDDMLSTNPQYKSAARPAELYQQ